MVIVVVLCSQLTMPVRLCPQKRSAFSVVLPLPLTIPVRLCPQKRSDASRLILSFNETLLGLYCRLLLLPVARSPFARTPLKIGDHFSSKGVRLLERAVPRLKDKAEVRSALTTNPSSL